MSGSVFACAVASLVAVTGEFERVIEVVSATVEEHARRPWGESSNDCAPQLASYRSEMLRALDRLRPLAAAMDDCISQLGDSASTDLRTTTTAMYVEVDTHVARVCLLRDRSMELARHVAALRPLAERARERAERTASILRAGRMTSMRCGH